MWEYEHSIETDASPAAIWRLYSDVTTWPSWDEGVAAVELHGPFAAGTTGMLTPAGQGPLPFRLTGTEAGRGFADETEVPGLSLRFSQRLTPLAGGRTRITHRITVEGPAADRAGARVGPAVTAEIPRTMASLAAAALAADAVGTARDGPGAA